MRYNYPLRTLLSSSDGQGKRDILRHATRSRPIPQALSTRFAQRAIRFAESQTRTVPVGTVLAGTAGGRVSIPLARLQAFHSKFGLGLIAACGQPISIFLGLSGMMRDVVGQQSHQGDADIVEGVRAAWRSRIARKSA